VDSRRSDILDWCDQGRIPPERLRQALALGGVLPGPAEWRRFLDRLFLFLGVALLAAAAVFFFAFNWQELSRFAKLALAELLVAASLALAWRLRVGRTAGQAALLLASLLTGALLALFGQVYQTGADTFELFASWAAAVLPWVVLARFPALWVVWIALVDLAAAFYYQASGSLWGVLFAPRSALWLLLALQTAAPAIWEGLAAAVPWLRPRWPVRLLATAGGACATALALQDLFDRRLASHAGLVAWGAWIAVVLAVYRRRIRDLYLLATGALSVIVVAASFLAERLPMREAGEFLLVGLLVIALAAAAGYWLKRVAAEEES
jgi:uncharacterized membrane protein